MSRINTNVQSLIAQRVLAQNNLQLSTSLERLSTGLRINRGKDDPAGLIASENLRSELKAIDAAVGNAERADQVVNIAEGGLQEVSSLLTELQGLVTSTANSAGLSKEEKEANQLQIDSILQTIDRIASSTSFQGIKLLNGNFEFQVSGVVDAVTDFQVNGAKFDGDSLDVNVVVTQSAQQAGLFLSMGATAINFGGANSSFVVEVAGALGSRELTFSSSQALTDIAATINTFTDVTGVEATVSATGIKLASTDFGDDEFVSVKVVNDGNGTLTGDGVFQLTSDDFDVADTGSGTAFGSADNGVKDVGQDVGATVNGIAATSDGKTARINTDFLDLEVTIATSDAQTLGALDGGTPGDPAFTITGGGADFQLSPNVDIAGKVSLGIKDVAARKLGNSDVGFLDALANGKSSNVVDGDLGEAQKIVSAAISQVSSLRGRLGAFQRNTIGATVRNLNVSFENTQAAESTIRDADFAKETAGLTRSQILVNASTNVLALANQQPQSVLSLLG